MELNLLDFERINQEGFEGFYKYRDLQLEICLEPCLNGFCIGAYDLSGGLLEPKQCLNAQGYGKDLRGTLPRKLEDWNRALYIANGYRTKYSQVGIRN